MTAHTEWSTRAQTRSPYRTLAALVVSFSLALGSPARATERAPASPPPTITDPPSQPMSVVIVGDQRPKKHQGLGLALGSIAGTILGLWAGYSALDDNSYGHMGSFYGTWAACAVGGGLAGYALGGGFSHQQSVTAALEHGREAVRHEAERRARLAREAEATSTAAAAPLGTLRLSSLPGLEPVTLALELERDDTAPTVLTASAR